MISHRYSCGDNESMKDKITYYSLALLEWDHGEHCTVVEGAWLGGLGGAGGKSNWIEVRSIYKSLILSFVGHYCIIIFIECFIAHFN